MHEDELFIPRVWHGTHIQGLPGYETEINDLTISIGIHSSDIVSVLIQRTEIDKDENVIVLPNLSYWTTSLNAALQWIANSLNIPVMVDEEEAIYPESDFDDGDDGEIEEMAYDEDEDEDGMDETEFDDGDDGDNGDNDSNDNENTNKVEENSSAKKINTSKNK